MLNNSIQSKAIDRVITQYQGSVKFISMIGAYSSIFQEIKDCHDDMMSKRFVDTAQGAQLDIIGDIVGQSRLTMSLDNLYYFGFQRSLNTQGFATIKSPTSGGLFKTSESDKKERVAINDEFYRILIKAKIQKNICSGTPDEIINAIMFIFNCSDVILKEQTLSMQIGIGKNLTHNEIELIKEHISIIPRPLEVKLTTIFKYREPVFGFKGCPKSKGFSSSLNPNSGGYLSTIIISN